MTAARCLRLLAAVVFSGAVASSALASGNEPTAGGAGQADAQYVELDALTVTIFRDDAPVGQLTTRLVLQLHPAAARSTVVAAKVKLRDAMLRELFRLVEREARNGPTVDLDLVKARMVKVARSQLGPDIVADVLVQALLRRGA